MIERTVVPPAPIDLGLTLGPLRHGPRDPTFVSSRDGLARAWLTPAGPATISIEPSTGGFAVRAWGPGAEWALEQAPALLGFEDDPSIFTAHHDVVAEMHRRLPGMRMCRTGTVLDSLMPAIIEQKVHGVEAFRSWRALVLRYGEKAPGPFDLVLPPPPSVLTTLSYADFHPFGIERRRAEAIRRVAARAARMEEAASMPPEDARKRLRAIDGVGAWTAAECTRVALGDPDAVSVGDFHLPSVVAWVLAGERRADDARMLELLEPYTGQRARAIRLIEAAGDLPKRRAPRARLRSITRM